MLQVCQSSTRHVLRLRESESYDKGKAHNNWRAIIRIIMIIKHFCLDNFIRKPSHGGQYMK